MIKHLYIGPGRQGNYLAGYYKPCTRIFIALQDCNTEHQARQAVMQLDKQSRQRDIEAQPIHLDRRPIAAFYNEE